MSNAPDDFAQFMRQREAAALDYVNGNPESLIRLTANEDPAIRPVEMRKSQGQPCTRSATKL
jgi:hypothetical protein